MSELKTYTINAKNYSLGKLTWKQRKLTSAFEQKLREQFVRLYEIGKKKTKPTGKAERKDEGPDIAGLFQVSIDLDSLLYSDDGALPIFLATLLVPAGESFDESKVPDRARDMELIDEETLAAVVQDFFARTRSYIGNSMSAARISEPSGIASNAKSPGPDTAGNRSTSQT